MSTNEDTSSPAKRQRLDEDKIEIQERTSLLSRLERIPLEILADIFSYVNSPNDVLSVSRCSKHLRATLLNPSNVMIWRRARRHCVVPDLPPPLPGWCESAYAAFIFDPGNCYVCGVPTKRMYFSFVGRVRLCGKPECRTTLFKKHVAIQIYPDPNQSESEQCFYGERLRFLEIPVLDYAADSRHYCLMTDVVKTNAEYKKMTVGAISQDEYLRLRETDSCRQHQMLEHAKLLSSWCQQWRDRYRRTKTSNMEFARKLAKEAGWNLQDLLNTPTFCSLLRCHNACLENISAGAVRLLFKKFDAEILSQVENRAQGQKAHAQQTKRANISRLYDRLLREKKYPVIPNLAEFRVLPIIKTLQDRDDVMPALSTKPTKAPRVLESELERSDLISGMIDGDVKKWVDTAVAAFDSMLGFPNWKSASTRILHPAERITVRFICTLCNNNPKKKRAATASLDFRETCAHQCAGPPRKAAAKRKWKAGQFVLDQKAIDVLSNALSLLGLRAQYRDTEAEVKAAGAIFMCKSCDSPIVMDFRRLAGHCRRHDEMQLKRLSVDEALSLGLNRSYNERSLAKYSPDRSDGAKQMKVFGCRHCQYTSLEETITPPQSRNGDAPRQRRFTFNGLISHAKEKHKILRLGDEDFFRDVRDVRAPTDEVQVEPEVIAID